MSVKPSRVTIGDIARRAHVSKATVSRVLNSPELVAADKREAVLAVVGEMGFQPNLLARGLASGRSMTIGIVTQNIGTSFYDDIIRSIIERLRRTQYSPIFGDGLYEHSAEIAAVNTLRDRQVDGIILLGGDIPTQELSDATSNLPLVVVARELPEWAGVCLSCDNFDLGYRATKHLIECGHAQIAHVAGDPKHQDAIRRTDGYRQALADAGIAVDPELIYDGNFYGQAGVLAVESWLMRVKDFTAIFAANDLTAYGCRLALSRRRIRVPDEISLVGIDDKIESALIDPPLTTMRQPAAEMGLAAADAMLGLIDGKPGVSRSFTGRLIERESVRRLH